MMDPPRARLSLFLTGHASLDSRSRVGVGPLSMLWSVSPASAFVGVGIALIPRPGFFASLVRSVD